MGILLDLYKLWYLSSGYSVFGPSQITSGLIDRGSFWPSSARTRWHRVANSVIVNGCSIFDQPTTDLVKYVTCEQTRS